MKKISALFILVILIAVGCKKEVPPPVSTVHDRDTSASLQYLVSEIKVGSASLQFIVKGTDASLLEKNVPGSSPLLGKNVEGLTLQEIHRKFAPGKAVPKELLPFTDRFGISQADGATPVIEGNHLEVNSPVVDNSNARVSDLNDTWFRDNYCGNPSFYNGYHSCMLNRTVAGGFSTDWSWSNCTRSNVYVYPYQGSQIHLQGKVDGSVLFDVDLLSGYVYYYYMYSGTNFWGCRSTKKHYYTITPRSGTGWHWNLKSNTDC